MSNLFSEFAPTTYADWEKMLGKALKGRPLDSLDWQVDAHLCLKPLYRNAVTTQPITCLKTANWEIGERFEWAGKDVTAEKGVFLQALQTGAQVAEISITAQAVKHLDDYLDGIWLDMIVINWCFDTTITAAEFVQYARKKGINKQLRGHFLVKNSTLETQFSLYQQYKNDFSTLNFFSIELSATETNSSRAEKLAEMLLNIDKIYQLCGSMRQVAQDLRLVVSIGAHFWVEIAQIRAVKKLWFALCQSLGENIPCPSIQAETQTCLTDNEHYNQIVASSQALSAAIGRVNVLTVRPRGGWANAGEQARRLARNIQHILIEESHINAVADAAAGSFYLENATQQLVEKAWGWFREKIGD